MKSYYLLFAAICLSACATKPPRVVPQPAPFGAVPTMPQLAWQHMEYNAFVHFNMNTFTNIEWGMGSESPALFNPTALDCRQWVRTCKAAGMRGIIITAKHHDGFCLWPSKYTEHSVKNAPWRSGRGDVIRELSDAAREYGLKFGIYLSPWDRNHALYGKPEYITYFHNQLRELLTNYGPVFEVWFDGANGGDGYYGGANERREVDRQAYYDWPSIYKLVHELQPDAVIFSDGGPGCRWVGNENGIAAETNWSTMRPEGFYPGTMLYDQLPEGHSDGTAWIPAECDVSIRPGWYYHPEQDDKVKSLEKMREIYYKSVGRNGLLLLNLPVDKRGLVHENDSAMLVALRASIDKDFSKPLVQNAVVTTATGSFGANFEVEMATDGSAGTAWVAPKGITTGVLELQFAQPQTVQRVVLQEAIWLGQRITSFSVEARMGGKWEPINCGEKTTTIGYKRIVQFAPVRAERLRITLTGKAEPCLAELGVY